MTELLAERAERVIGIELDAHLAKEVQKKFQANPRIVILQADILRTNLAELCRRYEREKCFVFGNLPYYVTSPIIHHLLQFAACIRGMGLLVQLEVAERLTAAAGARDYGYLSVFVQLYSQPRMVLGVPPGAFSPPPKVHSALVSFEMTPRLTDWGKVGEGSPISPGQAALPQDLRSELEARFLDFVKRCFAQKRKNLLNNLSATYSRERAERELAALSFPPTIRAEQLTLEQFASLFQRLRMPPS
jgi:16S rRNA (adenine1518-N6/adenine1519-N6)-dimethyltransferase